MKNIAIINVSDFSSPGKIALGLHTFLQNRGYNSIMCYAWGREGNGKDLWRFEKPYQRLIHAFLARITGLQGFFSRNSTKKLIKRLKKDKIDTIYGLSMHGYFLNYSLLYDYVSKEKIVFVNIMIDEYPYLGKCCFNNGCLNYLTGCGNCPQVREFPKSWFFDTSRYIFKKKKEWYGKCSRMAFCGPKIVIEGAQTSPLLYNKPLYEIDEAIDVDFFKPRSTKNLREKLGIDEKKFVCMCIAPSNNPRKGVQYYIELARLLEYNSNFVFVHVGYLSKNKGILPSNYIPIGYVKDQELLSQYYSLGDLFVFPSLADSMPNACLEAMACGTPLMLFDISGMNYMVNHEVCKLVRAGDVDAMKNIVLDSPRKTEDIISKVRNYALSRYDSKIYFEKLIKIGESLI